MRIRDGKILIRDKHPGSATLHYNKYFLYLGLQNNKQCFLFLFHRKFSHTSARRDHEGGHTGEKPFRCLCGERYCSFGKDMIIQNIITDVVCIFCRYQRSANLWRHKKRCSGAKEEVGTVKKVVPHVQDSFLFKL